MSIKAEESLINGGVILPKCRSPMPWPLSLPPLKSQSKSSPRSIVYPKVEKKSSHLHKSTERIHLSTSRISGHIFPTCTCKIRQRTKQMMRIMKKSNCGNYKECCDRIFLHSKRWNGINGAKEKAETVKRGDEGSKVCGNDRQASHCKKYNQNPSILYWEISCSYW